MCFYYLCHNKKKQKMKVGDKVRFIYECGGGVVTGFR